jgi:D-psicose/D-tagatose/L-ribulose 3-epimerase
MLRFGYDTWLWTKGNFERKDLWVIKEAKRLGGNVIDFAISDHTAFPTEEASILIAETGLEPITSTTLLAHNNPISPVPEIRAKAVESMKALIDITKALGGHLTAGVNYAGSGCLTGKLRTKRELEWSAECMRDVADYAMERDIVIAIEPVKRFESHIINRAEQALEYIELVGRSNVGVHLDCFHMNIEEPDIPGAVELCGGKLKYMHMVDSNRGAPGQGHIPWLYLFKALKKIGFNGPATFETFGPDNIEETYPITMQGQKFAETTADLCEKAMRYLNAVQTMAFA